VVDRRVSWGEVRLYFYDEDGCLQYMPEAWTDRSPVDPFVVLGGGEAWFRVVDLLRLTTLLAGLEGEE
jgi:hypothetical protein